MPILTSNNQTIKKLRDYLDSKPITETELKGLFTNEEIEFLIQQIIIWKVKIQDNITVYFLY
jgi:hypothetical protein